MLNLSEERKPLQMLSCCKQYLIIPYNFSSFFFQQHSAFCLLPSSLDGHKYCQGLKWLDSSLIGGYASPLSSFSFQSCQWAQTSVPCFLYLCLFTDLAQ